MHQPAFPLIIGVLLLFFGRKLFWLFVAAAGFVIGAEFTPLLLPHQPEVVVLGVAILLGIAGAVLAILFQEIAIAVAGFFFGANFFATVVHEFFRAYGTGSLSWIVFGIGGIIGAVLLVAFFDWVLIVFSSLEGAHFIVGATGHLRGTPGLLLIGLAALGIVVQAAMLRRWPGQTSPPSTA